MADWLRSIVSWFERWWNDLGGGTIGEWVSGVGALAAVVATVVYSRRAERARETEEVLRRHRYEDEARRQAAESALEQLRHREEAERRDAAEAIQAERYRDEVQRRTAAEAELRTERNKAEELARTEQARKVFVWRIEDDGMEQSPWVDGAAMHNGSDLPVFEVAILGFNARTGGRAFEFPEDVRPVVLPHKGYSCGDYSTISSEVWISFRDANGTSWARSGSGELVEDPALDQLSERVAARVKVQARKSARPGDRSRARGFVGFIGNIWRGLCRPSSQDPSDG